MIGYGSEAGITIRVPEILNYEYLKTIREELTYLKDYIPPILTEGIDLDERRKFRELPENKELDEEIIKVYREMRQENYRRKDGLAADKDELLTFVECYPQWSDLVNWDVAEEWEKKYDTTHKHTFFP